jgi:hypothetical protein
VDMAIADLLLHHLDEMVDVALLRPVQPVN